jgi:serine/threonine-protein kinase
MEGLKGSPRPVLRDETIIADKYLLKQELGHGAHGVVYRAVHLDLGKHVAVKLLRPDLKEGSQSEKRFLREVCLATSFVHKYAVQLRDFGRDRKHGCFYYTMDLVRGETLSAILKRETRLEEIRVIALFTQILEALEEAHDAGIVHRDLKPNNLLVTIGHSGMEEIRILDFGLAKAISSARGRQELSAITMPGMRVGTLAYMSPEQAMGRDLDARSDLYAVAVMIYQALSGIRPCLPRKGASEPLQAFLVNLTSRPPVDLRRLTRTVSPALRDVVMKALSKKPKDRYLDARAFREALHKAADAVVLPQAEKRRRSRRLAAVESNEGKSRPSKSGRVRRAKSSGRVRSQSSGGGKVRSPHGRSRSGRQRRHDG